MMRELERNPHLTVRVLERNNDGLFQDVSMRTVSRCIQDLDTSHRAVRKPFIIPAYTKRRVKFTFKFLV